MANSDGYLTTDPSGPWLRANTGTGQGDISSPFASPVYARFEHPSAPIPGTKVDGNGNVSEGPSIQFVEPGGLLSGAPAADSGRPYIVWAGVSPMSLSEALVVWNTNVALLNKGKIGGGNVVSLTGRLMVIDMGSPIAINGMEQQTLTFEPGAVGFYKDGGAPDACPDDPVPQTKAPAGGGLADPSTPPDPCACSSAIVGEGGGGAGGVGGANVDALLFSTICNPTAQCGEFEGNTSQFIVNNGLNVPVRCTHPFYLAQLKTGFSCGCGPCERDAEAWEASMELYGATLPGEVYPLDQLRPIDPCGIGDVNFSNGYGASLVSDVSCEGIPPCPTAMVEIVGRFGPVVPKSGKWNWPNPGYEGQAVFYKPECESPCPDDECLAEIVPDQADCFVPEDIIKPIQRTVPVSFFDNWFVATTAITVPSTCFETDITMVTSCATGAIEFVTDLQTSTLIVPQGDGALVSVLESDVLDLATGFNTTSVNVATDVQVADIVYAGSPQPGDLVTSISTANIEAVTAIGQDSDVTLPVGDGALLHSISTAELVVCDGSVTSTLVVITDISTVAAGTTVIDLITSLGTIPGGIDVIDSIGTDAVAFSTDNVATAIATGPLEVVDSLATEAVTVITNLETITAGTMEITIPTAFPTSSIEVVTSCFSEETQWWMFEECEEVEVLMETDEGEITLITSDDSPGCARPYRFLNHDGPIPYTQRASTPPDCCTSSAQCTTEVVDHPVEANCEQFLLLRANYVDAPAPPTRDTCPCYDCSSEDCEEGGGGPYEQPGGSGPEPCTINVRRLNRRWCFGTPCKAS